MKITQKPKNVLLKIVFSRTMIAFLLILVQFLLLFGIYVGLGNYSTIAMSVLNLLGSVCLVYLINKDDLTEFKLAWAIPICAFPVFGTFLFLFVDRNWGSRTLKHQLRKRINETKEFLSTDFEVKEELATLPDREHALFEYVDKIGGYPTYKGSKATYFPMGEEKWKDLLIELEAAKEFIFLEYFIVENGQMWDSVINILKRKAQEGVEVRVMYDGMCSIMLLPYSYPKTLQKMGIKAKMFSPIVPMLSTHHNNRDHRKILVIDGRVAYTGGVNFADEYVGLKVRFGKWKDTAIKITGNSVNSFTLMFLQMWNADRGTVIDEYKNYIRKAITKEEENQGFIMPYADGPHQKENVAERVYIDILSTAVSYVHIMTPYFIVDEEMLEAIKYAAARGVDVKLILPHIPDKKVAFAIARNYYPRLLDAGVKVYEYTPGFVHAKVFTSDNKKAVVGTINLDYRSLYHHFECATYLYDNQEVLAIEQDFQSVLKECRVVNLDYYKNISVGSRMLGCIANLFGPLL